MSKAEAVEVGRLNERLEVLELRDTAQEGASAWAWETVRRTWAAYELAARPSVYSVRRLGSAGVRFILRRQGISLDSALWWRGQHCFITAIRPLERLYLSPSIFQVQTQWGPVRVKRAQGFGVSHTKPEFEDVAALAREHGLSYQTVLEDALRRIRNPELSSPAGDPR